MTNNRISSYFILIIFLPVSVLAQQSGRVLEVFQGVGVEEHLAQSIPAEIRFKDEGGKFVQITDFFKEGRPVILNLVYHSCPMLCNLLLDGFAKGLSDMEWVPGNQFEVVTVSFSPFEGPELASKQKELYLRKLGNPEAAKGWHFLTGDSTNIRLLAQAVGFKYKWVEKQQQYAHPATVIFVGDDRRIMRYLYGLEYSPRELRNAIVEASQGTVGNTIDRVVLFCFHYDPTSNSYVPHAMNIMKLGGLLSLLLLGSMLGIFWSRERSTRERQGNWEKGGVRALEF